MTKDRPDPVVSYTRIPKDGGETLPAEDSRVEPHFTVVPLQRGARFEEVAAPLDVRARAAAEDIEASPAVAEGLMGEPRRRKGASRLTVVVGVVALLAAVGVLAVTFSNIFRGGDLVAVAPDTTPQPIDVTPGTPATAETAGPGVRLIPQDGDNALASAPTENLALPPAANDPAVPPPAPRLRPEPEAPAAQTTVAPPPPAPAPAGAAAPPEDDIAGLMSNVDRLLAERKAAEAQAAASQPAPQTAATEAVPLIGLMGGALPAALPAQSRRGLVVENPGAMPVPPADIPNPGN